MHILDVYARIRLAKVPLAVFLKGRRLVTVSVKTVRYRELLDTARSAMVGVYDRQVRNGEIEEDLEAMQKAPGP